MHMTLRRTHAYWLGIPAIIVLALLFWPLPASLTGDAQTESVRITDRNGVLLYEARQSHAGSQDHIPLSKVPDAFIQALVATEDRGFYSHAGVSLKGIGRAAMQNISAGRVVSGGSTITQQLVRIKLQPDHRGFLYKVIEAYLALRVDGALSKDDILEQYLNKAYFGHQAYGLQSASRMFFDKDAELLSMSEAAFLAGLLQSPTALDPFENMKGARTRQKTVLTAMLDQGLLDTEGFDDAIAQPIRLAEDRIDIKAPHFVMWLLNGREEETQGKTEVKTTLDLALQTDIQQIVDNKLALLDGKNVTSAAVVVLDAHNGDVLAMLGSADYFDTENDGAVNVALAARQPGSTMKPFTYALALSQGWTAATTVADVEARFLTSEGNPYTPRNYDFGFHGLVKLRDALANSYNIAAVRVLEHVGVANLLNFLQQTGISTLHQTPEHYGLALTLGDAEVKLLELTQAYGLFARGGMSLPIRTLENDPIQPGTRLVSQDVAWLISDILSDNTARIPEFGENSALAFDFPVAAKTGTTRNSRDNWTIGYTPDRVVGVWVGNADNSPMRDTSGVTGAGPIFHEVVEAASRFSPKAGFVRPSTITETQICKLSGKLPTPDCPATVTEKFIRGTQPTQPDDIFKQIAIDTRNGLLGEGCDAKYVKQTVFAVFPAELRKWARENGWKEPPAAKSPLCATMLNGATANTMMVTNPANGASFRLNPMIPDSNENIVFEARADDTVDSVDWYVDGTIVGTSKGPDFLYRWHAPKAGFYKIEARHGALTDAVSIIVEQ